MKKWNRKFNRCIKCKTIEIKHKGYGFCSNCYMKEYRKEPAQKEKEKQYMEKYNQRPMVREKTKERIRKYKQTLAFKKHRNEYEAKRRKTEPKYRLDRNIGKSMSVLLKGAKEGKRWKDLVNYSVAELILHLESLFDNKMNWENYGSYWHVDHVIPKSWFVYKTPEDIGFKMCWDLDNLQPLEAMANCIKSNKLSI